MITLESKEETTFSGAEICARIFEMDKDDTRIKSGLYISVDGTKSLYWDGSFDGVFYNYIGKPWVYILTKSSGFPKDDFRRAKPDEAIKFFNKD